MRTNEYFGITKCNGRYRSQLVIDGKHFIFGYFATKQEAAQNTDVAMYHLKQHGWGQHRDFNFPNTADPSITIPPPDENTMEMIWYWNSRHNRDKADQKNIPSYDGEFKVKLAGLYEAMIKDEEYLERAKCHVLKGHINSLAEALAYLGIEEPLIARLKKSTEA